MRILIAALISSFCFCKAAETKLTLLHINDHHSHLTEGSAGYINIFNDDIPSSVSSNNGDSTYIRAYYGGFPRLVTGFKKLEMMAANEGRDVLKLHAGDAITGTTYFTLFEGDADAKLMNHLCLDAFSPGNHEFDKGDAGLARFLTAMKNESMVSSGCPKIPAILGANIEPHADSALLKDGVPPIGKHQVFTMKNGEKVGVIGINIKRKTMESSQPDPGTILRDEKEVAVEQIAQLTSMGVNKIVLLTHIGYKNDQEWLSTLPGVDVIVGGDSHSLLGDNYTAIFGTTRGPYATIIEKADGTKTCVVQAWDYSKIIGNLQVDFDTDGHVVSCYGSSLFPLNPDTVTVRDASPRYDMSAGDAALVMQSLETLTNGQAMGIAADADAAAVLANYTKEVQELSKRVVTTVPTLIKLESGGYESGACDLVAQGFLLNPLSTADVAIQNRGGCRSNIDEGNFTVEDAYTLLPFSNTMVNLNMTGSQIKNVLEDAIDFYLDPTGSWGAYPRASGLRFDVNEGETKGSRVSNLEVNPKLAGSWEAISTDKMYTVVTNNFIATPRDGYYEFGKIEGKVDTYVEYAQSFIEYAQGNVLEKVPADRASTQNWSPTSAPTSSPTPSPTSPPTPSPAASSASFLRASGVLALAVLCVFL